MFKRGLLELYNLLYNLYYYIIIIMLLLYYIISYNLYITCNIWTILPDDFKGA